MQSLAFRIAIVIVCFSCLDSRAEDIGIPDIDPMNDGVVDLLETGLEAWKAEDDQPIKNWQVRNDILVNGKPGSHLITRKSYRDFDLSLEFNLPRRGNSGVYLRGRYEVQLYDGPQVPYIKETGSIWGQIPVETRMYKGAGKWNELKVRIKNDTVTVLVNRKPVIRSQKLKKPTRGAVDDDESKSGPILLQSLRGVRFRNILIKEL